MNSKIKLGIIGCGRAAELIYSPALNKLSDFEVSAVLDPIRERRELLSSHFNNCVHYGELSPRFIDHIDAAIISTPPDTHVAIASELLKRDKYILVEKPLALTLNGIQELISVESTSKASLMMGFNHRYWQPINTLREKLLKNDNIISVQIIFTGNYNSWSPVSFQSDPLNDLGPHVFDLVRFIFNEEIKSISAQILKEDIIEADIKTDGNIFIKAKIAHSVETEKTIRIISKEENYIIKKNSIRLNPQPGLGRDILDYKDMFERKLYRKTSPIKKSYEIQLNNFFNYVKENKKAEPGIKDGISAISAVQAALRSINNNGEEVFLDEIK